MITGAALARVGLLGNPSDGYGGRVLAMTVPSFHAEVTVASASEWHFAGTELLRATVTALQTRWPGLVAEPAHLAFTTTIPRQVGLSGSSAIIIAGLRALATRSGENWDRVELARVALDVETEVLGWAAGPQDRVVQSYEGLVDMNFDKPWDRDGYARLDLGRLPPLFLAWDPTPGSPSHRAHSPVRERWEAGEPLVVETMRRFTELAVEGRRSLDAGQAGECWPSLMDQAFELRSNVWDIAASDRHLVEVGQALGAGVTFAGSGGAVVGSANDPSLLASLASSYHDSGAEFLVINK